MSEPGRLHLIHTGREIARHIDARDRLRRTVRETGVRRGIRRIGGLEIGEGLLLGLGLLLVLDLLEPGARREGIPLEEMMIGVRDRDLREVMT